MGISHFQHRQNYNRLHVSSRPSILNNITTPVSVHLLSAFEQVVKSAGIDFEKSLATDRRSNLRLLPRQCDYDLMLPILYTSLDGSC